jgi:hypothetical protein
MSELFPGTRVAKQADMRWAYDSVGETAGRYGYTTGITGSLLFGDGNDIDMIVTASFDAKNVSGAFIANEIITAWSKRLYSYEELAEDASTVAVIFKTVKNVVLDIYVVGLPEG